MVVDKILPDSEFGHIYIKCNARAVRFTFRPANDGTPQCGLLITVPQRYRLEEVLQSVERMRPKLRQLFERNERKAPASAGRQQPLIDWDFRIQTDCLSVSLARGTKPGFYLHHEAPVWHMDEKAREVVMEKSASMTLYCPPDCDFTAEGRQEWLEKVLVEGVRTHAKDQLLPRLLAFARLFGFDRVREVKVNSSKGRWGSCAQHRQPGLFSTKSYFNINLSLFTLLLPLPVQRLILLHELNHTRHMDHSAAFHQDLDRMLGGREELLEQELKRYTTSIFSFQR